MRRHSNINKGCSSSNTPPTDYNIGEYHLTYIVLVFNKLWLPDLGVFLI